VRSATLETCRQAARDEAVRRRLNVTSMQVVLITLITLNKGKMIFYIQMNQSLVGYLNHTGIKRM